MLVVVWPRWPGCWRYARAGVSLGSGMNLLGRSGVDSGRRVVVSFRLPLDNYSFVDGGSRVMQYHSGQCAFNFPLGGDLGGACRINPDSLIE